MSKPTPTDEFFVGYLPVPGRLGRWLAAVCVAGGLAAVVVAGLIAARQRDPGPAVWDTTALRQITGRLELAPYPSLHWQEPSGEVRAALLVSEGKIGAPETLIGLAGKTVSLAGYTLTRGDLHLLELDGSTPSAPAQVPPTPPLPTTPAVIEPVDLFGEIVDPKCYTGAMKPGEGKTHKACAVLCIRGGIPPVFVADSGKWYILCDERGGPITGDSLETLLPWVGDPVRIMGTQTTVDGLTYVRTDVTKIRH